jgi:Skp family chaperone for outer membrane proteins
MNPQAQVQKPAFQGKPQAVQMNMAQKADVVAFGNGAKVVQEGAQKLSKLEPVKKAFKFVVENIGKIIKGVVDFIKKLNPMKLLKKPPVA